MRRIEILAFENAQLLDVTGPLQVFTSANEAALAAGLPRPYDAITVATSPQTGTTSGLSLATAPLPDDDIEIDTLIVVGGRGVNKACEDVALIDWIRRRSARAWRTASVCSGAFLLAEAGLLEGKRAVTHWHRCTEFSKRFPNVKLEPDPIFIQDGEIWTSAGVTAGIDLTLALVEADLGRKLTLAVARELVVFLKRPGGQAQFSTMLTLQEGGERFDRLHGWIMDNLRADLSLPALADQANMSARSFSRHYRLATGRTPARAVEDIRVEAVRRLLEQGLSVRQARMRCGFGSEETLRRSFLRSFGTTPQAFSDHFG
ncbi:helix-turn-helix domain-containing protein [Agrobacterium rhizogenes]|uniref:GlxA family transcriptional regulator n=1 Tax=Rhizobium rhizogenes TaxID=359 RepID=UPI0004DA2F06|nr:helix-turn-helix domain-containing protein [Rhizobium rhizogenes]KAA6476732.1 AraC family transcriptional regulator [Agrobacterium sp. ICMP 7243]OCJ04896.1 AraC family transcriptional regulator [Agrobacterium sp. 13-626]OCJ23815.1 AraC family transcriptional regulator [Agrobacterium sp. B133/95]KEA03155.1 AraC family transcriptional regulator [Rhizobium rhizogenes]MDJ1635391.1 DJ-1/PfpI family protein [Rhizobium rhizogenes]